MFKVQFFYFLFSRYFIRYFWKYFYCNWFRGSIFSYFFVLLPILTSMFFDVFLIIAFWIFLILFDLCFHHSAGGRFHRVQVYGRESLQSLSVWRACGHPGLQAGKYLATGLPACVDHFCSIKSHSQPLHEIQNHRTSDSMARPLDAVSLLATSR